VLGLQVPDPGTGVPLSTSAPKGTGILPYTLEGDQVISEVVVPVHAAGTGSPLIGYLLNRRPGTNASNNSNEAINRLLGSGGRLMVGNRSGSIWIDLAKRIDAPGIDVSKAGTQRYRDAAGETRIAGVAHVPSTPLAIVVDFPEALIVAPAWTLLRLLSVVGVVFTLLSVAIVWHFTGRITRPLNRLTDVLDAMAHGQLEHRVPADQSTEVGRLGAAFNAMADRIESGVKELELNAHALAEEDRRKTAMMNAALDGILMTDVNGLVVGCNPAAEHVFGYDRATLQQQNLGTLLLLPEYGRSHSLDAYLTTAKRVSLNRRIEVQAQRRGGELFPVEISLVAIRSGGAPGFAVFVRDLTEQKAGEELLLRGILLEEENRRVIEASRLKSEFLANMSHELRTPLNAIIGFAELLYDGQVTPDMPQFKDFMHDILNSGHHLLQLINDVLDLSKIEAGRLDFHPEDTDLSQVVTESIGILRTLAAQKQLIIASEVDASIGPVFVDRARLKQVLYNYLSNAIKFTPDHGRVTVRVYPTGDDHFRVEVTDTGIGISDADQQRLFIEFNQLEAGAAKTHQGTGLGLALTKRLIEAQGGSIGVESTPGQGSTFYAVLPKRAIKGTPLAGPRSIASRRAGGASVLVIEDSPADQEAIARALIDEGFSVETATSRAQALVKLDTHVFDAITLDLILPDASGADVLRDLRSSDRNRHVPVVVITVVAGNGAVAGFAVSDILTKPVDPSGLINALQRAGVTASANGTVLVVDDDPGSLRLMAASLGQLGYRSTCVERAVEGLRFSQQQAPLAVVLDLQMPELDGFGFLERFRAIPACQHTPVIVWTVKDLTRDEYSRLQSSVQGIVGKGQAGTSTVVEELRRFLAPKAAIT
jgi:PAS domain S-box-containing protein